jgi:hypothetical protein
MAMGDITSEEYQFRIDVIERLSKLEEHIGLLTTGMTTKFPTIDARLSALEKNSNRLSGVGLTIVAILSCGWLVEGLRFLFSRGK